MIKARIKRLLRTRSERRERREQQGRSSSDESLRFFFSPQEDEGLPSLEPLAPKDGGQVESARLASDEKQMVLSSESVQSLLLEFLPAQDHRWPENEGITATLNRLRNTSSGGGTQTSVPTPGPLPFGSIPTQSVGDEGSLEGLLSYRVVGTPGSPGSRQAAEDEGVCPIFHELEESKENTVPPGEGEMKAEGPGSEEVPEDPTQGPVETEGDRLIRQTEEVMKDLTKLFASVRGERASNEVVLWDSHHIVEGRNASTVSAVTSSLRNALFHMYCLLHECSICLGALGGSGKKPLERGLKVDITTDDQTPGRPLALRLSRYELDEQDLFPLEIPKTEAGSETLPEEGVFRPESQPENGEYDEGTSLHPARSRNEVAFLPCGHKFCRTCLDDVVSTKATEMYGDIANAPEKMRIRCPLCRKKIKCTNVVNV